MNKHLISTIQILPFGMMNAFIVHGQQGAILVDTGLPGSQRKILQILESEGLSWSDLKLIVITHGHIDHAGSAKKIRELSGAPILLHNLEKEYCSGAAMPFYPTDTFARLFKKCGVIQKPYDYFEPDIVINGSEEFELSQFGISGKVFLTPGHTPGSVSLLLGDGNVLAGDLASSGILLGGIARKHRAKRPPFEESPKDVASSLEQLIASGAKNFFLGHGGPLPAVEIQRHVIKLHEMCEMGR